LLSGWDHATVPGSGKASHFDLWRHENASLKDPTMPSEAMIVSDEPPPSAEVRRPVASRSPVARDRYTSQAFLDSELAKVFGKVWQVACMTADLREVGDFYEYKIGRQSILIVRDTPESLRAFHNVCQHRGRQLKKEQGNAAKIRCGYHGWTWALDGHIEHVPERGEFCPFIDADVALVPVLVDIWECFVFVNLDLEATPLLDYLGDFSKAVAPYRLHHQHKWWSRTKTMNVNWKAGLDAFQEDYHARYVHPNTKSFVDYTDNPIDLLGDHSRLIATFGAPDALSGDEPSMRECLDSMEWTLNAFGEDTSMVTHLRELDLADGQPLREVILPLIKAGMQARGFDISGMNDAQLVDQSSHYIFPNMSLQLMSHGAG